MITADAAPEPTAALFELLAFAALAAVPWRGRAFAPYVGVALMAAFAVAIGATAAARAALPAALPLDDLVRVLAWTSTGIVGTRLPSSRGPLTAVLAGASLGALPTVALLAPSAPTGATAVRWALLALCGSVLTPLGGPAQLLLASPPVLLQALPLVAVVAAAAWPWGRPGVATDTAVGAPWGAAIALPGAIVAWFDRDLGLAIALASVLVATLALARAGATFTPAPAGSARAPWTLAWAVAVAIAIAVAQLAGLPWTLAWLLRGEVHTLLPTAWALPLGGLVFGCADPLVPAMLLSATRSVATAPVDLDDAVLGVALAPVPALLVAVAAGGWRTLVAAVPASLLVAGVFLGYLALTR